MQGVFFRDTVRRQANEAGLAGWAQNRSDGTVEAVFEGDPQRVDLMLGFCRQGPGRAEVSQVEVFRERTEGLSGFEVR